MRAFLAQAGQSFDVPVLVLENYVNLIVNSIVDGHELNRKQYGNISQFILTTPHDGKGKNNNRTGWSRSSTTMIIKFDSGYTWTFNLRIKLMHIKRFNETRIKFNHDTFRVIMASWANLISYSPSMQTESKLPDLELEEA